MVSSITKLIWIPALAVYVGIGGASLIKGQSLPEFELDVDPLVSMPSIPYVTRGSSVSNSNSPTSLFKPPATGRVMSPSSNAASAQTQVSSNLGVSRNVAKPSSVPTAGTMASRRNSSPASTAGYSKVTPLGQVSAKGGAVTASHEEFAVDSPPADVAVPFVRGRNAPVFMQPPSYPVDRNSPPSVIGSHLGLKPGETATERSLRLMSAIGDLERNVEYVTQQNVNLTRMVNQRDEKLQLAVREIRVARKDLASAKEELDRLKREVDELRQKVRNAEQDNAAVLQSMAPLLQRLLESDDGSMLPANPVE